MSAARTSTSAELIAIAGDFNKGPDKDDPARHPTLEALFRPKLWSIYPEITAPRHAASDHAAVWVDLDL